MESTTPSTPKYLRVRGEEIPCIEALPPGLIFDMAESASETDPMRMMAAIGRFLKVIVTDDAQEQLRAILYDRVNILDITELSAAYRDLIAEYAGRPLEPPSPLPNGSGPIGQSQRVVSFSRGTVETVDPSSTAGPSNES